MRKYTPSKELKSLRRIKNGRAIHLEEEGGKTTVCGVTIKASWVVVDDLMITCQACLHRKDEATDDEIALFKQPDRKIEIEVTDEISYFV